MKPPPSARLAALFRELGPVKAVLYLADRLLKRAHPACGLYFYRFLAQALAEAARLPAGRGKAYEFRLLVAPEPCLQALGRPSSVIAQRFAQGASCLAALREGRLAGCIWFVGGGYREDEVRADFLLPEGGGCVWDFEVYVAEAERGGLLFARLWDEFDARLRSKGVRWTLSRINAFNLRSLASHRRLGAADCGRALFLRLGAWQLMLADRSPFLHLSRRGRPRLRLAPAPGRAP